MIAAADAVAVTPQATRYGANALAGLIYLRSADPTPQLSGRVDLEGG